MYLLWKTGLSSMDIDRATNTMIGDPARDSIVVGKSKAQLQKRFGYLVAPTNASQYLRSCFQDSPWKDKDALFIRDSPWVVMFDNDRVTQLVLIKGC
jgi:hypothetical protein